MSSLALVKAFAEGQISPEELGEMLQSVPPHPAEHTLLSDALTHRDDVPLHSAQTLLNITRQRAAQELDIDEDQTLLNPQRSVSAPKEPPVARDTAAHEEAVQPTSADSLSVKPDTANQDDDGAPRYKAPGPGKVLKERFILVKKIGKGGMGLVYRARDLRKEEAQNRNPHIAIKVLSEKFQRHPLSLTALQREAQKSQALAHPNIVNVFDFDRDQDTVFMTMELLQGQPLNRLLKAADGKAIAPDAALEYIRQMARGLAYAHSRDIIHADLKPANIFLTKDGTIKLMDFGIARAGAIDGDNDDQTTRFDPKTLGAMTPAYASPQVLNGAEPGEKDDVFALGCVAYQLLAGRHPYDKQRATEAQEQDKKPPKIKGLSRRIQRALAASVAFDEQERLPSAQALIDALEVTWLRQHGVKLVVAGALTAALVIGAVLTPRFLAHNAQTTLLQQLQAPNLDTRARGFAKLSQLPVPAQQEALLEVADVLLGFYFESAAKAYNPSEGAYDYVGAKEALDAAAARYQFDPLHSHVISGKLQELEYGRYQQALAFDQDYQAQLAELAVGNGNANRLATLLTAAANLQLSFPIPNQVPLARALFQGAAALAASGKTDAAVALIEDHLALFDDNPSLTRRAKDLRQGLLNKRRAAQDEVQRLLAEATLERALASSAPWQEDSTAQGALDTLRQLAPSNPLLINATRQLNQVVSSQVAEALAADQLTAARERLSAQRDRLDVATLVGLHTLIEERGQALAREAAEALSSLSGLLGAKPLLTVSQAVAVAQEISAETPDTLLRQHANALVFEYCVIRATRARAERDYGAARWALRQGLALPVAPERQALGQALLQRVIDEQNGRASNLDGERVKQLLTSLAATVNAAQLEPLTLATVLDDHAKLLQRAPEHALDIPIRRRLAERAAQSLSNALTEGEIDLTEQAALDWLAMLPESPELMQVLLSARAAQRARTADERAALLARRQQQLTDLLADPDFSTGWDQSITAALTALERELMLPLNESLKWRQRVAETYLTGAQVAASESRFVEARERMTKGYRVDAIAIDWQSARQSLAAQEAADSAEFADKVRKALASAELTRFDWQLAADAPQAVLDSWPRAQVELSAAQDAGLGDAAKTRLQRAFAARIEQSVRAGEYDNARLIAELAKRQINAVDFDIKVQAAIDIHRSKRLLIDQLSGAVQPTTAPDIIVSALQTAAPHAFDQHMRDIAIVVNRNLDRLALTDRDTASALARTASVVLPANLIRLTTNSQ